jgi:hypothetical protein
MNADKIQSKHTVYDSACLNCGATRSKSMSTRCEMCDSHEVVFPLGVQAGYLYPEEENQIKFFVFMFIVIVIVVPLIFLAFLFFQYSDLFLSLAPLEILI